MFPPMSFPERLFQTRRKTDVTEQEKEAEEDEEDEDEKKDIQTEEKVTPRTASKRAAAKSVSKEEPELDRFVCYCYHWPMIDKRKVYMWNLNVWIWSY